MVLGEGPYRQNIVAKGPQKKSVLGFGRRFLNKVSNGLIVTSTQQKLGVIMNK